MKDEIDDIRESLDRLEAESQRRKNKLLEQVHHYEEYDDGKYTTFFIVQSHSFCFFLPWNDKFCFQGLTFFLAYSIFSAVLGMLQFGYNTGVINAPEQVCQLPDSCLLHVSFQVIEKFIRKAHRQRSDGVNMTYESSTFMYAIAVSIFAIGGMCGGFIGK